MTELTNVVLLSILKAATVALGAVLVALTWRVYRSSRRHTFLWLLIGFILMTLGAIAEGAAFQGLDLSLDAAHVIEALFTLAAFGALVYSLYTPERRSAPAPSHPVDVEDESG